MTRGQAVKWVKFVHDVLYEDKDEEIREALNMAIEALQEYEEVKAYTDTLVDAFIEDGEELAESVKVVRCKDCIHQEHCHETVAHTKEHDGFREHWSETIEWCSRGERKGGDSE